MAAEKTHWVSTVVAAQILGCTRHWVRMLAVDYGRLRYIRLPKNALAVCLEDVLRWKQKHPNPRRRPKRLSEPTNEINIEALLLPISQDQSN